MGITGMQFKLISRGDASKGDQKLVVTMEFNGVQYEGVLFANPLPLSTNTVTAPTSTPPSSSVSATSASPIGSLVSPVKATTISPLEDRADDRAPAAASSSSATSNGPTGTSSVDTALPMATNGAGTSSLDVSLPTVTSASTASCGQPQQMESGGGPTVPTTGISSPLVS
ncbi:hypothetical protein AND_002933 [Anopheles darlingi]|uniref:REKLES domain-containing protein n=1 Tax=Anopheles darlingi TaxID=43151 RepID=W5JLQ9_ANODA|nr:hypothetical protein AND_002933 [Anopheles darlingi]